jgi:hypothetical protein
MKLTKSPQNTANKSESENMNTEPPIFKEVSSFIQRLDDFEIEIRPNLNPQQALIAATLSVTITKFRATTDQYKFAEKSKRFVESHEEARPANDYERKGVAEALASLTPEQLDKYWEERYDAAAQLRLCMTQAKTHGMLRPGPAVLKRLKQCREENERLNKELVILGARNEDLKKKHERLLNLYPDARKRLSAYEQS